MKNILFIFFLPLLFVSCNGNKSDQKLTGTPTDTTQKKIDVVVKTPDSLEIIGNNVNIRVEPKLEAPAFKQLHKGQKVFILEKGNLETVKDNKDFWYKIKYKTKEGWIFGAFTSLKLKETASSKETEKSKTIK